MPHVFGSRPPRRSILALDSLDTTTVLKLVLLIAGRSQRPEGRKEGRTDQGRIIRAVEQGVQPKDI